MTPEQQAARERVATYLKMEHAACFCGHDAGWDYQTADRHGFYMTLRACECCGLLRTNPRPTPDALERYYREDFRTLYTPQGWEDRFAAQQRDGERIRGMFPKASVVVDIGCGTGGTLKPFHDAGLQVYGCDYDADYLARAREAMPNGTFTDGGADTLPDVQADLVIALHTIEHRVDLRAAIEEHRAKLKPGGYLWAEVPTLATIRSHYGHLRAYLPLPHIWHFTDRTFAYALKACGMSAACTWDGQLLACNDGKGRAEPDMHEPARAVAELGEYQRSNIEREKMVRELNGSG